jgi:hypothetical protein
MSTAKFINNGMNLSMQASPGETGKQVHGFLAVPFQLGEQGIFGCGHHRQ